MNDKVGIEKISHPQRSRRVDLLLYPNPSNGTFQITNPTAQIPKTIAVYDMQGRSVNFSSLGTQLTIESTPGIYLIKLLREDRSSEVHRVMLK